MKYLYQHPYLIRAALLPAVFLAGWLAVRMLKKRRLRKLQEREQLKIGREGEADTLSYTKRMRGYKKLLHNVYIPKGSGPQTAEADIVIIHEKGIFVIENKNYSGWIDGRENAEYWIQVLGKKKNYFYSPVRQNESHIRYLKKLLRQFTDSEIPCVSVITFNDRARLSRRILRQREAVVTYSSKAARRLNRLIWGRRRVLRRSGVDEIYQKLRVQAGETRARHKAHAKQVKNYEKQEVSI